MLELLHTIDTATFLFINVSLGNPVTNVVMPIITSDHLLRIGYGLAMLLLLWKGTPRLRWLVLFSAFALLLSDQISSSFLKPLLARPRPCHILSNINLLVDCGGGFAMPSSHAANAFAQATLFAICIPRVRWYVFIIAALISLSRVFVGVHYPFDIAGGAIVGTAIGIAVTQLFEYFQKGKSER